MDDGTQTLLELMERDETVMVVIHDIKDGIGAEPLLAGNDAIAVEIVEAEQLMGGFSYGGAAFELTESSGEKRFGIFQRLGEALNAFG